MLPFINVFVKEFTMYGIVIFIGLAIGSVIAIQYFSKFNNIKKDDVLYAILYALIGLGIGAKLLYFLTKSLFLPLVI